MNKSSDWNICSNCDEFYGIDVEECSGCGQRLVLDAKGSIAVWRLGEFEDGVLGPVLGGIAKAFGKRVVLQPSYLRLDPSDRTDEGWRGRSATVFLRQVNARHEQMGAAHLSLGITEENIVPSSDYNFLFGYAHVGAAILSLKPLRADGPDKDLLTRRAVQIAVHELGHGLGLDHHKHTDGIACVMVGEVEYDSLETIDNGTAEFCGRCKKKAHL